MKIYVYSKDGKVFWVSREASDCYMQAWYDFEERYDWQNEYEYQETEGEAFTEFCNDITTGVFDGEFEVTEWKI